MTTTTNQAKRYETAIEAERAAIKQGLLWAHNGFAAPYGGFYVGTKRQLEAGDVFGQQHDPAVEVRERVDLYRKALATTMPADHRQIFEQLLAADEALLDLLPGLTPSHAQHE